MIWAVLAASLVGSVHCVAMCGPLVGFARRPLLHALGRLTTYVALGFGAGALGSALDLAGELAAVQRIATILAAATILGVAIWQLRGGRAHGKAFAHGLAQLRTKREARRAYLVGVLTGLLPCGWLWAFVVSAAGTGGALAGAGTMAVFWLGTVPAMVGALGLAGPLVARIRARMPAVTAVALVALAAGTLAMRWRDAGTGGVAHPHCHQVKS